MLPNIISSLENLFFWALHVDFTNTFPKPLSSEQEQEYFRKFNDENDISAKNILIEHNLRLVAHIIKKYYSKFEDRDELISIGTIGLIKAVNTYCVDKNIKFATYASRCIENELLMYFRSLKKSSADVYIDEPIESDKDGNILSLKDIISDSNSIINQVDIQLGTEKLYFFIKHCLDERELQIIALRYGILGYTPHTQKNISKMLNISRSYVSRIEKKALKKLQHHFNQ